MSVIGEQIKKYRGIRGMTQQEIADALGESSGRVIYNWEKGIGRPDCDKLAKLCDLLGVSADEMIGCRSMSERPTAAEWETIKKYRVLDEHGKEIVDYLIDSEYKRVSATDRKSLPTAADSRTSVTGENSIIAHSKNPASLFFIFTASFPCGRSAVFSGTEPQSL